MKHIGLVCLSPSSGMLYFTADLARMLGERARVSVLVPEDSDLSLWGKNIQINLARTDSTLPTLTNFRPGAFLKARTTILKWDADSIHICSPHIWNLPLTACVRRHTRLSFSYHDPIPHSDQKFSRLVGMAGEAQLKMTDRCVVHGQLFKDHVESQYEAKSVTCIQISHLPGGINEYRWLDSMVQTGKIWQKKHQVLFLGRVKEYKGIATLRDAAQLAHHLKIPIDFIIAGEGNSDSLVDWPTNTIFLNRHISSREAVELLRDSSVLVLPYRDATQSALVYAGNAFGATAVVSNAGALPEYIVPGVNGEVFISEDAPGLLACIQRLLHRDNLSTESMSRARNHYIQVQRTQQNQWFEYFDI